MTQLVDSFVLKRLKRKLTGKFIYFISLKLPFSEKFKSASQEMGRLIIITISTVNTITQNFAKLISKIKIKSWKNILAYIFFLWILRNVLEQLFCILHHIQIALDIHSRKRYISRTWWKRVILVKMQVFQASFDQQLFSSEMF